MNIYKINIQKLYSPLMVAGPALRPPKRCPKPLPLRQRVGHGTAQGFGQAEGGHSPQY